MAKLYPKNVQAPFVKVYHGFGHAHDLHVFGHVFKKQPPGLRTGNNLLANIYNLLRLFFVKPLGGVPVRLLWEQQQIDGTTETDGFFHFEWQSIESVPAGRHTVTVQCMNEQGQPIAWGQGMIQVPHITQYGIISDIDDTIMVSHSATILKRLKVLFTRHPGTREVFKDIREHYQLLALAQTTAGMPNPFFYVSSSEWNLYDYLRSVFKQNSMPEGTFLLNQIKRWFEIWKTGKTKHEGKLLRIVRILESFPNQQFILLGDNSQSDPAIYKTITEKYAGRILAVYIRNVYAGHSFKTEQALKQIAACGVHTLQFINSAEAIQHTREIL